MCFILPLARFVATARAVLLSALACIRNDSPISFSMACAKINTTDSALRAYISDSVEISSLSSPHVNMSISNHSTTRKSWRSDTPIILPGWECHTGGSRSKPTVHRCRPKTGGCGLLTRTQDEPTKQHGSGASVAVPQPASQFSAVCDD